MTPPIDRVKVFRDTVHGYITVPARYCQKIIDTALFQRLRRIEQTSMRALYPCAHHDRFSHSLGVYFLGRTAFDWLSKNTARDLPELKSVSRILTKLQPSFELACLLHDCGHSPFSHIFEKYYGRRKDGKQLKDLLLKEMKDARFAKDLDSSPPPKEHEIVSTICCVRSYKRAIRELGGNPLVVVRMILGCKFHGGQLSLEHQITNCVIGLLNGPSIDVDKLDYASRDKWASGAGSANVDLYRLLSSVCLRQVDDQYVVAFYKTALGVIENALDAKEYMHYWIFGHHKVAYDRFLLESAVESTAARIAKGKKEKGLSWLFSVESLYSRQTLNGRVVFRPTDDDLVHFMKAEYDHVPAAREWLERAHRRKPLWKSFPDLFAFAMEKRLPVHCFDKKGEFEGALAKAMREIETSGLNKTDYCICPVQTMAARINENEIFIVIDSSVKCYTELGLPARDGNIEKYFAYVFVDPAAEVSRNKVLQAVRKFLS